MSPEQATGEALDERSDIFSLGTTFFHVLSGQRPFARESPGAVLVQIAQEQAPSLEEVAPQTPVPLAVLVRRMMARRREERYQDVGVILEDLASYRRRGLLTPAESVSLDRAAPPPLGDLDQETQAFRPPPGFLSDDDG